MNLVRVFIAVEIPPHLKEKLHQETESLRREINRPLVRWVPVENIHLTLKFLGEKPLSKLDALKESLAEEVAHHAPFEISIRNLGVFASFSRPRVIWAGVGEDNGKLLSLQKSVERAASRMGSVPEKKRFSAHLTLARVKQGIVQSERENIRTIIEANQRLNFGRIQVNSIHLFESQLKPTGAVYRSLFEMPLEG
ncbi:MAG: RNA 2',3'-cyclic phosphodiesterase [Anaerolineae bacterium]|jgi:RNA 2',3'-cyclic 3'-phosphodiesterase|nr:RNA 2',3'-cyclic phosphodiesterase [Anaerolineae bacterium]MBT7072211.1 RNA 2',3'-cyclic phosphodiesterase [Anaerolineae bacterium]MBT7323959.1 RNA 2',3'-cyclic phosphodiesterase [Anaerolineae bacterium]